MKYPTIESVVEARGAEWLGGLSKAQVEKLESLPDVGFTAKAVFAWQKKRGGSGDPLDAVGKAEAPKAPTGEYSLVEFYDKVKKEHVKYGALRPKGEGSRTPKGFGKGQRQIALEALKAAKCDTKGWEAFMAHCDKKDAEWGI